jgi:hypothetical protein
MIHYQLQCRQGHGFDGWFPGSAAFDAQVAQGLVGCPVCADTAVSRALMTPALGRSRPAPASEDVKSDAAKPDEAKSDGAKSEGAKSDGAKLDRAKSGEAKPADAQTLPAKLAELPMAVASDAMPDHVRALLQRLRAEVERKCDYVGPQFAEEARRIHKGEAAPRGIYGETTPEQAESLADEGIEVNRIPWVPRADG